MVMIPQTYEEWKHCIIHDCKIKLTNDFVKSRLMVYENNRHPETMKFIKLHGKQHLNNIINWLKLSENE